MDTRPSVPNSPTGAALDTVRGTLNVRYPEFMSKQDIVYEEPNTDPIKGLGFGNGKTGAMVWSQNGLTLQVSGVDLSQQSAFAAGNVALQTTPALDAGASDFEQRLVLYDGLLTTHYGDGREVTMMGAPKSEVIGIHVEDSRDNVTAVTVGGNRVRLNIMPSQSYTIWIAAASRLNAQSHDSVAAAKSMLAATKTKGYDATLADYKAFWNGFWQQSFVEYSNQDGSAD